MPDAGGGRLRHFELSTEVIRKGKASKPTEFGKMVKIQEAKNQIITDYEVYEKVAERLSPVDSGHRGARGATGCVPRLVAGDAAFYSASNEQAAHEKGVKRVCIPNRNTKSAERKREQKKRWFRNGQKWRTGGEGRISVVKRRHGLNRCRDKGDRGMRRWVGLGVIADNLINLGRVLARREKLPLLSSPKCWSRPRLFHGPPALPVGLFLCRPTSAHPRLESAFP